MGQIVLARIDDRLIHGQVMTAWVQFTGGNRIVIVDDETAADEFTKSIMELSVPRGIQLDILDVEQGAETLQNIPSGDKVIILAKGPETYLSLIKKGVKIEQVIIGGMGSRKERSKFYKNISATDEERDIFRQIVVHGVKLTIHIIPDEKSVSTSGLL